MRLTLTASALIASVAAAQGSDAAHQISTSAFDTITGWNPITYLLNYDGVQQTVSRFPGLFNRQRYHDLALLFTPDGCLRFPILKVTACGTAAIENFFVTGSKIPGTNETAQTQALFGSPEITFNPDKTAFSIAEFDEYIYRSADPTTRIDVHGAYNFTLVKTSDFDDKTLFPPTWKIKDVVYDVYVSVDQYPVFDSGLRKLTILQVPPVAPKQ